MLKMFINFNGINIEVMESEGLCVCSYNVMHLLSFSNLETSGVVLIYMNTRLKDFTRLDEDDVGYLFLFV